MRSGAMSAGNRLCRPACCPRAVLRRILRSVDPAYADRRAAAAGRPHAHGCRDVARNKPARRRVTPTGLSADVPTPSTSPRHPDALCRRGAGVPRAAVRHRAAADAQPGRRRGPGSGHVRQGVAVFGPVQRGHESEGVAVHDSPQHVEEPAPGRGARHGGRRQRAGRRGGVAARAARRRSTRPSGSCCATRSTRICRRRSTTCPTRFARRSGCATSKSSRTPRSRRCSACRSGR